MKNTRGVMLRDATGILTHCPVSVVLAPVVIRGPWMCCARCQAIIFLFVANLLTRIFEIRCTEGLFPCTAESIPCVLTAMCPGEKSRTR